MLRLSVFSCILLYVFLCTIVHQFVFFIPSTGCYICLPSGSQILLMVSVATLVIWLQPHGSFTHPQDNQFPREALSQVLLPIMWPNTGMSLSSYGIPCHVASLCWKSELTLNWLFPSSMYFIRCETLPCYVIFCRLDYLKEISIIFHLITFHVMKYIN